jgi:hypothetical protein
MFLKNSRRAGKVVCAGVAMVGAVLACAPIASADDPAACVQQGAPVGGPQPCDEQQQQPGMPDLPENRNANNAKPQQPQQAPQQSPQQAPQQKPQQGIDLADKDCWIINGVPVIYKPGTLTTGPGDVVQWCPTTYGLQPH